MGSGLGYGNGNGSGYGYGNGSGYGYGNGSGSGYGNGDGYGNGFTCANYNAHELYEACWRAKEGYWQKDGWPVLVKRAMECDFSWSNSAKSYEGLYNEVVNLW